MPPRRRGDEIAAVSARKGIAAKFLELNQVISPMSIVILQSPFLSWPEGERRCIRSLPEGSADRLKKNSKKEAVTWEAWWTHLDGLKIIYIFASKLVTIVEGDQKAPFSIATTLKCRGGHYSFPRIHIYPTPPLRQDMTQGHFLSGV